MNGIRGLLLVPAVTLTSVACEDAFFVEPAHSTAIALAVTADPSAAFSKANRVRVRVTGSTTVDTVVPFTSAEARVRLPVANAGKHQVEVQLRVDTFALFVGSAEADVKDGETSTVEVTVDPVPAHIRLPFSEPTIAIGDTGRARPIMATGDTIPTATWTTTNPAVLSIDAGTGLLRANAIGLATITGRVGSTSVQLQMAVCRTFSTATPGRFSLIVASGKFEDVGRTSPTGSAGHFGGVPVLFGGGVVFGNDPTNVVVGYDVSGQLGTNRLAPGPVCESAAPGGGLYTRARLRFVRNPAQPIDVVQETYAPGGNYVLVKYTVTNRGSSFINDFRVGLAMDWDLGYSGRSNDDFTRFDSEITLHTEAFESTGQIASVAQVQRRMTSYAAGINGRDPRTLDEYFSLIRGPTESNTVGPADIRQYIGFEPISPNLAPGQSQSYIFALLGAENRAQLRLHLTEAMQGVSNFPSGN